MIRVTWTPDEPDIEPTVREFKTLKDLKRHFRFNKPITSFPHKERYQDRYGAHVAISLGHSWSGQVKIEKID